VYQAFWAEKSDPAVAAVYGAAGQNIAFAQAAVSLFQCLGNSTKPEKDSSPTVKIRSIGIRAYNRDR
jgi:hypothetical protein